ncbi:hypothetical protein B0H12DRAFT_1235671 [Mycena haematopus]|nr:hypothetical protein B0H12DRAFT_1235671 [Mycena haematopus]
MAAVSGEDVKPDVKPDVSKIRITVQFNGTQLTFLIKKNKPLGKVLDTFCEKIRVDRKTVKFNFDGTNISQPELTAEDLGIEDEDVIDGQIFQVEAIKFESIQSLISNSRRAVV